MRNVQWSEYVDDGHYRWYVNDKFEDIGILRWGAFGDLIQVTPVFKWLKEEKKVKKVTLYCAARASSIVNHNPYIDEMVTVEDGSITSENMMQYWVDAAKNHDVFYNFSEGIEGNLLAHPKDYQYYMHPRRRHQTMNRNYFDEHFKLMGFPEVKGLPVDLHFTKRELDKAKKRRERFRHSFLIIWCMSGSAMHKAYPWADLVMTRLCDAAKDVYIITVGGELDRLIEPQHPHIVNWAGKMPIREVLAQCQYADMVIGPETGVMSYAGYLDTPTLTFLSHSSHENLTKYFKNNKDLMPPTDVLCYPCHKMHYSKESCPLDDRVVAVDEINNTYEQLDAPLCCSKIEPNWVLEDIAVHYKEWRRKVII